MESRIKVWDLPTRLFHWLLVLFVLASAVTGLIGGNLIDWHEKSGFVIVGLLAFRIVWGLIGSTYARFWQFFPTPGAIIAYLRGQWRGVGHNPLGACSVFALLAIVAALVVTGLFANDDISFQGPLAGLVDKALSNNLTGWHKLCVKLLYLFVPLHLASIAFYALFKKNNLLWPMFTGWKPRAPGENFPSAQGGGILAFVLAVLLAGAAVFAATGAWITPPPPPPAQTSPAYDW
ncbi:MAG: cytochrome b/b6 domain-containing protein [Betaproteobacteria bacterium]|nr:cytochrome b/b6 domain-containing protein [Betaproteobacteria bacterium]